MKIPHEIGLQGQAAEFEEILTIVRSIASTNNHPKDRQAKEEATAATERAHKILANIAQQLAAIATISWKMEKRLFDSDSGEVNDTFDAADGRKLARDAQALMSSLSDMGITVRDRTGQSFDYGMPEKVVDAKPQPGIAKERVAETLRPSVTWTTEFWKDTMIQKGEVIIHTPEGEH